MNNICKVIKEYRKIRIMISDTMINIIKVNINLEIIMKCINQNIIKTLRFKMNIKRICQ